jgi:hypothetical protein
MRLPRLEIDFVAPRRRSRVLGAAVLVLSLGLGGALAERYRAAQVALERMETQQGLLRAGTNPVRGVPRERLEEGIKQAEAVMRQLALPWGAIVRTIEEAATPEVAVLQLEPQARERQLRLTALARRQEEMGEYLRRLAAAPALADVHLASHQVLAGDPQRPIQFTVLARLKGSP